MQLSDRTLQSIYNAIYLRDGGERTMCQRMPSIALWETFVRLCAFGDEHAAPIVFWIMDVPFDDVGVQVDV